MNDIIVAGIGPGHPDYMLPAAARAIREAQVLVGGRRALAQFEQNIQQAITVLTARQTDHDFVTVLYHVVVANRLPHLSHQTFVEFIVFVVLFLFGWHGLMS